MENFLIALVVIGSLIYKFYSNYKEEMAKAEKRKQKNVLPPKLPTLEQKTTATAPTAKIPQETYPSDPLSDYSSVPEEVARLQKEKTNRRNKKIELIEDDEQDAKNIPFAFDLRDAVIQSAILERPYK